MPENDLATPVDDGDLLAAGICGSTKIRWPESRLGTAAGATCGKDSPVRGGSNRAKGK